jgi:hypothetical protein
MLLNMITVNVIIGFMGFEKDNLEVLNVITDNVIIWLMLSNLT